VAEQLRGAGAVVTDDPFTIDDRLATASGAGAAIEMALAVASRLGGPELAGAVRSEVA
jgi:transcriptional regulator GlxA family with amidase domain